MDNDTYYEMMFLENYIEFAALHRARAAWSLWKALEKLPAEQENSEGSIALEIFQCYLNSCEDLALWIEVLEASIQDESSRITDLLDRARFYAKPQGNYDSRVIRMHGRLNGGIVVSLVKKIMQSDPPDPKWAEIDPVSRERLRREIKELTRLGNVVFFEPLMLRETDGMLTIWRAWNKIKHGLYVTLTRNSSWGSLLTIRTQGDDVANAINVAVNRHDLRSLVIKTFIAGSFLGRTLNLVFQLRYERVPEVSWLGQAATIDMLRISRADMENVLSSSRLPRHDLVVDPRAVPMPVNFTTTFGYDLADDWQEVPNA